MEFPKKFINRVDELLEENIGNESSCIEVLKKKLLISYPHLYRKIRKETGLSPSQYIRKKKLEYAYHLIKSSDLNIAQIGYRVGFNSPAYFSKCFSEYYGSSPLKFRNIR